VVSAEHSGGGGGNCSSSGTGADGLPTGIGPAASSTGSLAQLAQPLSPLDAVTLCLLTDGEVRIQIYVYIYIYIFIYWRNRRPSPSRLSMQ